MRLESLIENSLWASQQEQDDLISKNPQLVKDLFWINTLGLLAIQKAHGKRPYLIKYFKQLDKARIKSMGDDVHDMAAATKLAYKAGFLQDSFLNEFTKLLFILKTKPNTDIDEQKVKDLFNKIVFSRIIPSPKIKTITQNFLDGKATLADVVLPYFTFSKYQKISKDYQFIAKYFYKSISKMAAQHKQVLDAQTAASAATSKQAASPVISKPAPTIKATLATDKKLVPVVKAVKIDAKKVEEDAKKQSVDIVKELSPHLEKMKYDYNIPFIILKVMPLLKIENLYEILGTIKKFGVSDNSGGAILEIINSFIKNPDYFSKTPFHSYHRDTQKQTEIILKKYAIKEMTPDEFWTKIFELLDYMIKNNKKIQNILIDSFYHIAGARSRSLLTYLNNKTEKEADFILELVKKKKIKFVENYLMGYTRLFSSSPIHKDIIIDYDLRSEFKDKILSFLKKLQEPKFYDSSIADRNRYIIQVFLDRLLSTSNSRDYKEDIKKILVLALSSKKNQFVFSSALLKLIKDDSSIKIDLSVDLVTDILNRKPIATANGQTISYYLIYALPHLTTTDFKILFSFYYGSSKDRVYDGIYEMFRRWEDNYYLANKSDLKDTAVEDYLLPISSNVFNGKMLDFLEQTLTKRLYFDILNKFDTFVIENIDNINLLKRIRKLLDDSLLQNPSVFLNTFLAMGLDDWRFWLSQYHNTQKLRDDYPKFFVRLLNYIKEGVVNKKFEFDAYRSNIVSFLSFTIKVAPAYKLHITEILQACVDDDKFKWEFDSDLLLTNKVNVSRERLVQNLSTKLYKFIFTTYPDNRDDILKEIQTLGYNEDDFISSYNGILMTESSFNEQSVNAFFKDPTRVLTYIFEKTFLEAPVDEDFNPRFRYFPVRSIPYSNLRKIIRQKNLKDSDLIRFSDRKFSYIFSHDTSIIGMSVLIEYDFYDVESNPLDIASSLVRNAVTERKLNEDIINYCIKWMDKFIEDIISPASIFFNALTLRIKLTKKDFGVLIKDVEKKNYSNDMIKRLALGENWEDPNLAKEFVKKYLITVPTDIRYRNSVVDLYAEAPESFDKETEDAYLPEIKDRLKYVNTNTFKKVVTKLEAEKKITRTEILEASNYLATLDYIIDQDEIDADFYIEWMKKYGDSMNAKFHRYEPLFERLKLFPVIESIYRNNIPDTKKEKQLYDIFEHIRYKGKSDRLSTMMQRIIMQGSVKNSLNSVKKDSLIPILKKVSDQDIHEILKFNNFTAEVPKSVNYKPSKDTPLSYLKKHENFSPDIPEVKVDPIEESEEILERRSLEYTKYYNRKHGKIGVLFKKTFNVNLKTPELEEWKKTNPDPIIFPAFHGTGSIAANMILRFGFKIVTRDIGGVAITGKMLGNGVYFSNVLSKAMQYLGDNGFSRSTGTIGYIFEMNAYLGKKGVDYSVAGIGGDHIRSPEWCVFNPRAQLEILKVHRVMMVDSANIFALERKYPDIDNKNDIKEQKTFKELILEANQENEYFITYIFHDGTIPDRDGNLVDFDVWEQNLTLKEKEKAVVHFGQLGPEVVFKIDFDPQTMVVHVPSSEEMLEENPEDIYGLFKKSLGW